jgi:hypothetical protein
MEEHKEEQLEALSGDLALTLFDQIKKFSIQNNGMSTEEMSFVVANGMAGLSKFLSVKIARGVGESVADILDEFGVRTATTFLESCAQFVSDAARFSGDFDSDILDESITNLKNILEEDELPEEDGE